MRLKGRRALVLGLGKSGLAAVRFLVARGAVVEAADALAREDLPIAVAALDGLPVVAHFGGHPEALLARHDLIVPSPGVPWDLPGLREARRRGATVCGELELAAAELRGRVIGITGTNGKTTTASLVDHVLRASAVPGRLAGNIGTPVLEITPDSRPDDWTVLELSSFQLEAAAAFRCHIAAVLNVTPDHLDRHGSFSRYAAAKARILRNQLAGDTAILNAADVQCRKMECKARGRVVRFARACSRGIDSCAAGGRIHFRGADIGSADLPIKGGHNLENALAAVAACSLAGLKPAQIGPALQTFQPVEHRMEWVRAVRGVSYYNDSKATNVAAAAKACASFEGGVWAILGGQDKGSDYAPLGSVLRGRARAALLIGAAAQLIGPQIEDCVPTLECRTLKRAVEHAAQNARLGDTVLLAPACASFDQYPNYVERGREFRRIVAGLGG
ncbi:MAG: UDP-N-acetylmuramoyl-L-alanine--D-glutamate ligase [Bryobacterales bacterium]|nr:UDP-N-acetylmuramoyl-L-alanine--D-glutamate ligase [Bryobacterales bacterium]